MVINKEIIDGYRFYKDETSAVIMLSFLHYNGVINSENLKAKFKQLKNGTLLRNIKTHKSSINNKWYYDQSMINVLYDCFETSYKPKNIPIKDFINYVILYTKGNKSYSINWIYYNVVEPFLNKYGDNYELQYKFDLFEVKFDHNVVLYKDYEPSGYCCEDHDGDYAEYKYSNYKYYIGKNNLKKVKQTFISYLNSLKKYNTNYYKSLIPDAV